MFHHSSSDRQRQEHRIFEVLLQMVPGLEDCVLNSSEEDVMYIAKMVYPLDMYISVHILTCS